MLRQHYYCTVIELLLGAKHRISISSHSCKLYYQSALSLSPYLLPLPSTYAHVLSVAVDKLPAIFRAHARRSPERIPYLRQGINTSIECNRNPCSPSMASSNENHSIAPTGFGNTSHPALYLQPRISMSPLNSGGYTNTSAAVQHQHQHLQAPNAGFGTSAHQLNATFNGSQALQVPTSLVQQTPPPPTTTPYGETANLSGQVSASGPQFSFGNNQPHVVRQIVHSSSSGIYHLLDSSSLHRPWFNRMHLLLHLDH